MFPTNEQAIALIDRVVMEDLVWRYVYGEKVEQRLRDVINWTGVLMAVERGPVPTMKLLEHVEKAIDSTRPTARKYMEIAYERGLVSRQPKYDDDRFTLYFLSPEQLRKRLEVERLISVLPAVVERQVQEPANPDAGSDMVPRAIYVNIVSKLSKPDRAAA